MSLFYFLLFDFILNFIFKVYLKSEYYFEISIKIYSI